MVVSRSESPQGCQRRAGSQRPSRLTLHRHHEGTEAPVVRIPSGCKIICLGDTTTFPHVQIKLSDRNKSPRECAQEKQGFWGRTQVTGQAEEAVTKGPSWHPGQTEGRGN